MRNVEELDSGWGDDKDDNDNDDDDDDDEANEPALPDEQLDPVAYAEAKRAREERVEARRERRRVKTEAKKARRKVRADAQKSKQKGKQRKARAPQQMARPERSVKQTARTTSPGGDIERDETHEDEVAPSRAPAPRSRAKEQASSSANKPMLSKTNQWMLAFAVIVFIAAAAFAAVVAR